MVELFQETNMLIGDQDQVFDTIWQFSLELRQIYKTIY